VLWGLERRVSIFSVLGLGQSRARFTLAEAGTPDGGVTGEQGGVWSAVLDIVLQVAVSATGECADWNQ